MSAATTMLARAEEASDPKQKLAEWLKRHADYRSFTSVRLQPLEYWMAGLVSSWIAIGVKR